MFFFVSVGAYLSDEVQHYLVFFQCIDEAAKHQEQVSIPLDSSLHLCHVIPSCVRCSVLPCESSTGWSSFLKIPILIPMKLLLAPFFFSDAISLKFFSWLSRILDMASVKIFVRMVLG